MRDNQQLRSTQENGLNPHEWVAGGYIGPDTPCFAVLDPDEVLEVFPERAN